MLRAAVAGGTGYTGVELVRLLLRHPEVELVRVTSEQYAGERIEKVYPSLHGRATFLLEQLDGSTIADGVDVVFSALPHGTAAETVVKALGKGARVIDLSADFRLRDPEVFRRWYGEHPAPGLLDEAVYGIPEFFRETIRPARLVANPGCYPTGALFGLVPLARSGVLRDAPIIVDSKSAASGAGRSNQTRLLFTEVDETITAYGIGSHRHTPELLQELGRVGVRSPVVFTPHLLPIRRGILTTLYVQLQPRAEDLSRVFEDAYGDEPFVHLLGEGASPSVRDVRGTNSVQIGWKVLEGGQAVVLTAIDNLGRGAASQAVQNLNVLAGFDETTGIDDVAPVP